MNPRYLQAALDIGAHLAGTAVWHEDRCNWLGVRPPPSTSDTVRPAALGPDLYGGTSGIALFLAELYATSSAAATTSACATASAAAKTCTAATASPDATAATSATTAMKAGESSLRHTALGALRQALRSIRSEAAAPGAGLFSGRLGIALAAARVGILCHAPELLPAAAALAHEAPNPGGPDLISGRAGAITGLLALHVMLDDDGLLKVAVRLGDEELRAGGTSGGLTGLSHGAAGVGAALVELAQASGDGRYLRGAREAFAYEAGLFDRTALNWPDLRERPGRRRPPVFATTWCHGAPGIALSRLRAYERYRDPIWCAEARTGIATTRAAVAASLAAGRGNWSLCHGLAGNAEVLGDAVALPDGVERAAAADLAVLVAEAGLAAYGRDVRAWRCGVTGGPNPDLLQGLAGIGLFFLRRFDPRVPSVLLLRPEAYRN
jgi:lantibiotic modifying enzyme